MTVQSIGDINREIANRCRTLGLRVDCAADGLFNAEIAIIAEAPGEREATTKLPLSGGSGAYLWDALRSHGITRRNVYISNVVKRRLAIDPNSKEKIGQNEVDQYAQVLKWELEQLPNLKYVILLGNYALQAVTGLSGITHCRGSVYDVQLNSISQGTNKVVRCMAMYNPAYVMREPKLQVIFRFDVGRLVDVINGDFKETKVDPIINPSFKDAMSWIDRMQDERLPISIDIETIGGETACVGLTNLPSTGMCISLRGRNSNVYSEQEEVSLWLRLQKLGSDQSTRFVMQNAMFDTSWLYFKDRVNLRGAWFDTMLAHHTLYPTLPHDLGFLTSQYTTHPFYKDEGKSWREGGNIDQFWEYNVKDICITLACQKKLHEELRAQHLESFFFDHVMRLHPELVTMTVGGVLADRSLKDEINESLAIEVARLKADFVAKARAATGDPDLTVNPGSPKQLAELFFRRLHLVGRGVATDAKNRAKMMAHPKTSPEAKEMILALDRYAKEQKFFSTYVSGEIDEDNRWRSTYRQTGTTKAPGRLSSAETGWNTGTNLQNQPERAHPMFIADEGYMFSYFDKSQAEARVVGWKAGIRTWIEQFERARLEGGYDAHIALASEMFNVPYDEVPKEDRLEDGTPTLRFIAKRCRHGLNYRMGPDRLAETTGLSLRDATNAYYIYHKINPELKIWWDWTTNEVKTKRKLFNAYGRRWVLLGPLDESALESVVAFYPQSTIGDKVCRVIYQSHNDPEWPRERARIILNIHDALIAIHKPEDGELVRGIMKKYAEEPLVITDIHGEARELIIPADFAVSVPDAQGIHRWSTLKKLKKPYSF